MLIHLGLDVTATTSAKNADFVRSLGADRVIAYDRENYLEQGGATTSSTHARRCVHVDAFKLVKRGGAVISAQRPAGPRFRATRGAGLLVALRSG